MARYLITGGAGFIGSNVVDRLLADGHEAVVIDNLSTGKEENLAPQAELIEGDIAEPAILEHLGEHAYDGVVHLAGQSSGVIAQENPYQDMLWNVASTVSLIRWSLKHNVPRFLYASSMTVYGGADKGLIGVDEDHALNPRGYYGVGKMASENYLRVAADNGLSSTIFRFYSVYGPKQNLNNLKQGMLSIYLAYLLKKERLPVTGSLERYRDLVYVGDVVDAIAESLYRNRTPSMVYNVGSGRATTVRDLIATLIDKLKLPKDYPVDELAGDAHDIFGCVANVSKLEKDLGWRANVFLDEGIERMLAWVREAYPGEYPAL